MSVPEAMFQAVNRVERAGCTRRRLWRELSRVIAATYLGLLALAEVVTNLINPSAGLMLHGAILFLLVLQTLLPIAEPSRRFLLTLAFAPLIRLLSLTLPLAAFPRISWSAIVSTPILVGAVLARRPLGLDRRAIGLTPGDPRIQIPIALTGLILGLVEYQILGPVPLVSGRSPGSLAVSAVVLLLFTGFFEELIFRGLLQSAAMAVLGRPGLLYGAILFAVMHLGWKSALDVGFVFLVGLFFGWVVDRTHSLAGVSVAHGLNNVMLFLLLPILSLAPPGPSDHLPAAANTGRPASPAVIAATPVRGAPDRIVEGGPAELASLPPTPMRQTRTPQVTPATASPSGGPATAIPALQVPADTPTPPGSPTAASRTVAVVDVAWLNVRAGPGRAYPVLLSVPRGRQYAIIGRDESQEWWLVCCPVGGNVPGWVYAPAVITTGDRAAVPVQTPGAPPRGRR